ncbi:MAG: 30S ribosomal protein S7 [Candidatus Veblenbacteria bacterium]|nr:30S ribosomal protein S7 [Candidatus Veblenbacteria bacterium]MDZ4229990.1 30S ribosomal protein S7 [Candidatus Veblenbacteria bacterium]
MRGKKQAPRRVILPDPQYQSVLVAKFINKIMERGKKTVARKIVYQAFDVVHEKTKEDPRDVFELALKNVAPQVEVKSRRVGGANYQVPVEVRGDRRQALAFRWLIEAANGKKGRPMHLKLAEELVLASKNEGDAIKKKMDVHRMAEANRAFAHFA